MLGANASKRNPSLFFSDPKAIVFPWYVIGMGFGIDQQGLIGDGGWRWVETAAHLANSQTQAVEGSCTTGAVRYR